MPPEPAHKPVKTSLQIHLSALLGAALVAYLTARGIGVTTVAVFVVCLLVIDGGVMFFLKQRVHKLRQEGEDFQRSLESVTLDEARSKALEALAKSHHCRPEIQSDSPPMELPATVSDIFSRYKRVAFRAGDLLELGAKERGFIHVGRTYDGAKLIVREADEGLFESEGPDSLGADARANYPSLLHWIFQTIEN